MTTSEKYVQMNHAFILLRDAIFADEAEGEKAEDPAVTNQVLQAMGILNSYLDYYKKENDCKTKQKKDCENKGASGRSGNVFGFPQ